MVWRKQSLHISPYLRNEGISPFSDLLGNLSCGSFACLSSRNAKGSCPGIVLLQLGRTRSQNRTHWPSTPPLTLDTRVTYPIMWPISKRFIGSTERAFGAEKRSKFLALNRIKWTNMMQYPENTLSSRGSSQKPFLTCVCFVEFVRWYF